MIQELTVIGVMSGTSLDGVDLCCARFNYGNGSYAYEIIACKTYSFTEEILSDLKQAYHLEIDALGAADRSFGIYIAGICLQFIDEFNLSGKVDLIGSHGQTIFHQPEKGITVQIGDGQEIATITDLETVNDFRIKDVELGGQGAPLVPVGDRFLFGDYNSCLNLGGIANISFERFSERIAFDISPANLPLNKITSSRLGKSYDKGGINAKTGSVNPQLLSSLNLLSYYNTEPPKSMGYEWLDDKFYPLLDQFDHLSTEDILRTIVEHETSQIAKVLRDNQIKNCLVTGGGAFNTFFMDSLRSKTETEIVLPDKQLIEFKEALIFAFLAFLNYNNQVNTLSSVTGAKSDSIGGKRYSPLR